MTDPSSFRSKRRYPRLALVIGVLIAASMAVACSPQPSIPAADPDPVHLGLGLESLSGLAFIAEAQDFFTGEGLVVQTHRYPSGRLALKGLLAGEVEIATAAQTPVTFAAPQYPDLRILAVVGSSDNEMKLLGRRDHGISNGADLRGKTIATQPGSSMHFFTHLYLLRHRVSADAVTLLFRPPDQLAGLLTRGEVDAIASREPLSSQVRDSLGANAIVLSDRGLYVKMYLLVCRTGFLKRRPTVAPRLLRALLRAETFARQEPDAARAILAQALSIPATNMARLWPDLELRLSLPQALLLRLEDEARWASENDLVPTIAVPDYFGRVELAPLKSVKPDSVSIIH